VFFSLSVTFFLNITGREERMRVVEKVVWMIAHTTFEPPSIRNAAESSEKSLGAVLNTP
jgi:hypothetical protein